MSLIQASGAARTRELSQAETANLQIIADSVRDLALVYVTETQLKKSIMDATDAVRTLLRRSGVHQFEYQAQGEQHKVLLPCVFLEDDRRHDTLASVYRPSTKSGDPRFWMRKTRGLMRPGDVIALFMHEGALCAINATRSSLYAHSAPLAAAFLAEARRSTFSQATQLLARLNTLYAGGFVPAQGYGDTAVGRTLETALGIAANSSKSPDYLGIELKAQRAGTARVARPKANLFAQVPDWTLSPLPGFREMLKDYGYDRGGGRRLYCTVELARPNSQGLLLRVDHAKGHLLEKFTGRGQPEKLLLVWRLETLHSRLLEKHAETFWVTARSATLDGREHFHFTHVVHTRAPSVAMFDTQLDAGAITVDHLLKLDPQSKTGAVKEKGPLFKLRNKKLLPLLFPSAPLVHALRSP